MYFNLTADSAIDQNDRGFTNRPGVGYTNEFVESLNRLQSSFHFKCIRVLTYSIKILMVLRSYGYVNSFQGPGSADHHSLEELNQLSECSVACYTVVSNS